MTEPSTSAWDRVGESFAQLGRTMRDHFEHGTSAGAPPAGSEGAEAPAGTSPEENAASRADAAGTAGPEARGQDPLSALREALDQLVAVGRDFGERASSFTRDETIKAQAKQVATSISDAVEATVDSIGREVGGWFKKPKGDVTGGGAGEAAVDTTASDAADVTPLGDAEPPSAGIGGATVQADGDPDEVPPAAPV